MVELEAAACTTMLRSIRYRPTSWCALVPVCACSSDHRSGRYWGGSDILRVFLRSCYCNTRIPAVPCEQAYSC